MFFGDVSILIYIFKFFEMIEMLQISSCFFGTIIVAAHVFQHEILFHLFTLITIFSIMYHSNKQTQFEDNHPYVFQFVKLTDFILAHLGFAYVSLEMWRHESILIIFSLVIIFLWIRINTTTNLSESNFLHLCLHITSIAAVHLFLIY